MQLFLTSKSTFFIEEHDILSLLFEEGLPLLYLNKVASEPVYFERLLSLVPTKFHERMVVNQHYYLKNEFNLKGIYQEFPEKDSLVEKEEGFSSCLCEEWGRLSALQQRYDDVILSEALSASPYLEQAASEGLLNQQVTVTSRADAEWLQTYKKLGIAQVVLAEDFWAAFDLHRMENFTDIVKQYKYLQKIAEE